MRKTSCMESCDQVGWWVESLPCARVYARVQVRLGAAPRDGCLWEWRLQLCSPGHGLVEARQIARLPLTCCIMSPGPRLGC